LIYSAENNAFLPRNEINRPILGEEIKDFNNYKNRTKIWCYEVYKAQNRPADINGVLEVIDLPTKDYIKQVYYGDTGDIYYRVCSENDWQPWRKLVTDYEFNQILALAKAGTKDGLFKFTPSKGVLPARDLLDSESFNQYTVGRATQKVEEFHDLLYAYYSIPVQDNIKNYTNVPPVNTSLWFYVIQICIDSNPGVVGATNAFVGYLHDHNNLNSIEWWRSYNARDLNGNLTHWEKWEKHNASPWDNYGVTSWHPAG